MELPYRRAGLKHFPAHGRNLPCKRHIVHAVSFDFSRSRFSMNSTGPACIRI
jgi:hypothetical protein